MLRQNKVIQLSSFTVILRTHFPLSNNGDINQDSCLMSICMLLLQKLSAHQTVPNEVQVLFSCW